MVIEVDLGWLTGYWGKIGEDTVRVVETALAQALERFHRRMIVIEGESTLKAELAGVLAGGAASILGRVADSLIKSRLREEETLKVLYATDALGENTFGRRRYESFRKHFDLLAGKNVSVKAVTFKHSSEALGATYDILIIDLSYDFSPNDIGRLMETVRGGGLIFVLANPLDRWGNMWTGFHKGLVTPPYTIDDVKKRFNRRLIRKIEGYEGIYIMDESGRVVKGPRRHKKNARLKRRPRLKVPEDVSFPPEVYELAITGEQAEVIRAFEELIDGGMLVLTADRGRGKSAGIGMGAIGLAMAIKKRVRVVVTAPEPENVQTLFQFAMKALERLNIKPRVVESNGMVTEMYSKGVAMRYYSPAEGYRKKADIYLVDEAAGIHVPILYRYLDKPRVIYSSTVHGYEGAGRGFSVKFLRKAREKRSFREIRMEEPIRYAENDPIERWLFDVLLLDAEPADLVDEDSKLIEEKRVYLEEPDLDDWFENDRPDLRQFVGIYVLAHYRNRPSDVAMLADAPHHEARVLRLENGKIVTALQIAREGGIPRKVVNRMAKGYKPRGNIIPDMMVKHHCAKAFARLKGYRIVRIATHPDAMDRGLGSKALELLEEEARNKGLDWIGSGFGASEELVRFWVRNGFAVVHLSPARNPVSGEYTAIVVKPLSREAKDIIKNASDEFRIRLTEWLSDTHRELDPGIVRWLFETPFGEAADYSPPLTDVQRKRLDAFTGKVLTYDTVLDAVKPIVKLYFLDGWMKPYLDERQAKLLIYRVLQTHSWEETARMMDRSETFTMIELRDVVRGLWYYYKRIV